MTRLPRGPHAAAACRHGGFHSAQARYFHAGARMRFVIVCDDCLAELREIGGVPYRPAFAAITESLRNEGRAS